MNLKQLLLIIFLSLPMLLIGQELNNKKLASGFYRVSDQGISLNLQNTKKYYNIYPKPILTTTHIVSTKVDFTPYINGKRYPVLTIVFDEEAINALKKLNKDSFNKHKIGLVLNNKLLNIAEVMGVFTGLGINLQFSDHTIEQVNILKSEIDNSR